MTVADKELAPDSERPSFAVGTFRAAEFVERTRRELIDAIRQAVKARKLTQHDAATLCGTFQSSLWKLLQGDDRNVSIERMMRWLIELGGTVEIRLNPYDAKVKTWHIAVAQFLKRKVDRAAAEKIPGVRRKLPIDG